MSWWQILLLVIGVNWGLPLLTWLYPLAMTLIWKDFVFEGFHGPFAKFRLAHEELEPWHVRFWKDWGGIGLYWFMCYKNRPGKADDTWVARTILHESSHCIYEAIFGLFFWVLYWGHSAWIFITQKIRRGWIMSTKTRAIGRDDKWMRILEEKDGNVVRAVYEDDIYTKHAYLDNWFERQAREKAGQLVDVPPYRWMHGKDDVWPWW
jgi:hypothetical protein